MPLTVVATGKTGAGLTMTAQSFDCASFDFNVNSKILSLTDSSGHVTQISVAAATTFTWVLVGTTYTVTVS